MGRHRKDPDEPCESPQITFRGRTAFVLNELKKAQGGELGDAVRWIVENWIGGEGRKILLESYGVDILAYRPPSNVVPLDRGNRSAVRDDRRT
jgi:hypothetical protein